MKTLYVLDKSKKFDGYCQTSITGENINEQNLDESIMDYGQGQTFKQYKEAKGGELIAVEWEVFKEQYLNPYYKSLQKPFKEITYDEWNDMLNCLPPDNWHDFAAGLNVFFMSERYTGNLTSCYIRDRANDKYYTALRPDDYTDEQLLIDFNNK